METFPFTIVTTIDLRYRPFNIIKRMDFFFKKLHENKIPCAVGYRKNNNFVDKIAYTIFKKYNNIKVVDCVIKSSISNSILRNAAINVVDTCKIIISDIDIYPDISLYKTLYQQCNKGLSMAPVLYLSNQGTKKFLMSYDINEAIYWWKNSHFTNFLHLAIPSSLICINKDDYLQIGGFDEQFIGHGYEDFDFLIRLGSYLKILNIKKENFFIDETYTCPIFSQGFRKELAFFALKNCLIGKIGIHLFHKKNCNYKTSREKNKSKFKNKYKQIAKFSNNKNIFDLLMYFCELCNLLNINPSSFSCLFISNKYRSKKDIR